MNLHFSVIAVGAMILTLLQETKVMKYDELLSTIMERKGDEVKESFLPTLSFLYIVGKIEYFSSIDSIGLIKA